MTVALLVRVGMLRGGREDLKGQYLAQVIGATRARMH